MSAGEAIFARDGDVLVPSGHARGPWDPGAQHGGAPAALVATEVQALAPDMQVARLTYEFLGPVPLAPVAVAARIVKPGRRFQLAEATVSADGRPVLVARAVLLRRETIAPPALAQWPDGLPGGGPQGAGAVPFADPGASGEGFHLTGMTIRFADGTSFEPGPAHAWFRLERDLVAGEPLPPVARVAAAADFGNGVSRVLDWDSWLFVNCDLSVTLLRDPEGPWVLLDARTRIEEAGIGWAASTLYDERGPIGFAQQTLFVSPR